MPESGASPPLANGSGALSPILITSTSGRDARMRPCSDASHSSGVRAIAPQAPTKLVPVPTGFGARIAALPAKTKLLAGVGIAALLAVLVALGLSMRQGDYKILFANVSEKELYPVW